MAIRWKRLKVLGLSAAVTAVLGACGGAAPTGSSTAVSPAAPRTSSAQVSAKPSGQGREEFQAKDKPERPEGEAQPAAVNGSAPLSPANSSLAATVAAAAPAASPSRQAVPNDIRGVYVYSSNIAQISAAYAQSVAKSLNVPGVDGLVLVAGWDALEPAMNQYQWTALDRWISQAATSGRKIELAVPAGSDTPAWLFQPAPAGPGVRSLSFTVSPHSGKTEKCDSEAVAPPWDPAFLGQWDAFLSALAAHLKDSGTYGAVKVIRLTGINRTTDELRLPAETPQSTHLSCVTDSISTWQQAGYKPSLLAQAWDGITSSFQKSFPDKTFSVAIIPQNPFPAIGDDGSPIKGSAPDENQPLLALASKKFPGHLVIQMNFLMPGEPASPAVVQAAQALGSLVAFQTNNYFGSSGQGAACAEPVTNPTPCTAGTYLSLLQTGIYPLGQTNSLRSQYIEVFPANALTFPDAIQQAHSTLAAP